jgi:hypothetical protein
VGSKGLITSPASIALRNFAAGQETDVTISIDGAKAPTNQLLELIVRAPKPGPEIQHAVLAVANGVASTRHQIADEFFQVIYSPRYVAKVWFMESGAAMELLDPQGYRRNDATTLSYPSLLQTTTDSRGRVRTEPRAIPNFPYFIPIVIKDPQGGANQLYEGGRHAHGRTSSLEQWFTEDWIVVRHRDTKPDEKVSFVWAPRSSRKNHLDTIYLGRDAEIAALKKPGKVILIDDVWAPRSSRKNHLDTIYLGRDAEIAALKKPGKVILIDEEHVLSELSGPQAINKGKISWPRSTGRGVRAVFVRPHGFDYGYAMFYPSGSELEGRHVQQPGDKPMGFTFCMEEEFVGFVAKWCGNTPTGQIAPEDASRYHGAFMAQPISEP